MAGGGGCPSTIERKGNTNGIAPSDNDHGNYYVLTPSFPSNL